jgi:hypothetical protein
VCRVDGPVRRRQEHGLEWQLATGSMGSSDGEEEGTSSGRSNSKIACSCREGKEKSDGKTDSENG